MNEYDEEQENAKRFRDMMEIASDIKGKEPINDKIRSEIISTWISQNLIEPSVKIVEKIIQKPFEYLTSEEAREYNRQKYWKQKELKEIKDEEARFQLIKKDKMNNRNTSYCLSCCKTITLKNKEVITENTKTGRRKIIILGDCESCGRKLKLWGGWRR